MTTRKQKAQAVRQVLLSDPSQAGAEYDGFRAALRTALKMPLTAATVDYLYVTLPKTA
jgi:hypothetical protein